MFQYLGSRGAQPGRNSVNFICIRFNTWAREEPNFDSARDIQAQKVSILGLARSPTWPEKYLLILQDVSILGLARSPTVKMCVCICVFCCFNTWAREEPNPLAEIAPTRVQQFQYLGSRGAQQNGVFDPLPLESVSILGLARSPTWRFFAVNSKHTVSILGLARSPTCRPLRA